MNTRKIQLLLNKYFEGNTSLIEEQEIAHFFQNEKHISPELIPLKAYFNSISSLSAATPSASFDEKLMGRLEQEEKRSKKVRSFNLRMYITSGIAAAFMLMLGFQHIITPDRTQHLITDPNEAMIVISQAFSQVNENMEKGLKDIHYIGGINQATKTISRIQMMNEAAEKAVKVHYLNKGMKAFQQIENIPKSNQ